MNPFSLRQPVFRRSALAGVLAGGLAMHLFTLAMLYFLVRFWEGVLARGENWTDRAGDLWALGFCVLAGQGCRLLYGRLSFRFGLRSAEKLREKFWKTLLNASVLADRDERNTAQEGPSRVMKTADALEPWYGQFLPQAVLAVIMPVVILTAVFLLDPLTGVVLLATGPLLPLFLALLGIRAKARAEKQWRTLARLRFLFLESLSGLKTLKIFGRSEKRLQELETAEDDFRTRTMAVLRSAFLSALVLEWGATLGTALVAVEVALRLLTERLEFFPALLVLLWTPEFYRPIRQMGLAYHTSLDARTAYKDHPELFCDDHPDSGQEERVASEDGVLELTLQNGERIQVEPGRPLVITGPSGTGKTRMLLAYLGHEKNDAVPNLLTPRFSWSSIGWLPQQSVFFEALLWDNLCPHGRQEAAHVWNALQRVGLKECMAEREGLETPVQEQGRNFSGGERRRLALARLLLQDRPLWILDEPLAGLDSRTALPVLELILAESRKRTLVMVTHQLESLRRAERICFMRNGHVEAVGNHEELRTCYTPYRHTVDNMRDPS